MDAPAIRQATFIKAIPSRIYECLTTGAGWDSWFTSGAEVDPRIGGFVKLRWRDFGPDRTTCEDGGPVVAVLTNRQFAFKWSPASHATTVNIALEERDSGTLVVVTETGYTTSEDDLKALVSCACGWGEAMTLFKYYLEYGISPTGS